MISEKIKNLKGSPTLALAAKAGELKAAGEDVISLSVGEPDWDTFPSIKQAAKSAIDEGQTKYTPVGGTPALRSAIANQTNKDLGTDFSADQVTASSGGKYVIFSALNCLLNEGDEVLIPSPYWVSYPDMVTLIGGKASIVKTMADNNFKLTSDELERAITEKTKLLILNSPSNPTGEIYTAAELKSLSQVLDRHPHVMVMSDDIYNRLVFLDDGLAPHILQQAPQLVDRVIVVNGVSKTYSMTGWRLGWALGPKELVSAMTRYQSQSTSCASSVSQAAAIAAIQEADSELRQAIVKLKERRDYVFQAMSSLPGIKVTEPQGAFYIWPDVRAHFGKSFEGKKIESSADFAQALLESQKVVTVPGNAFGQDGFLRVSYALEKERMSQAIERISDFLSRLA